MNLEQLKQQAQNLIDARNDNNHELRDELACKYAASLAEKLIKCIEKLEAIKNNSCCNACITCLACEAKSALDEITKEN